MDSRTLGVLGGGQLGKMMIEAGNRLGVKILCLDPGGVASPAGKISPSVLEGSFRDEHNIKKLVELSDIITTEIEHVDCEVLSQIQSSNPNLLIRPSPQTISLIQDKYRQKVHFSNNGINGPAFSNILTIDSIYEAGRSHGYPIVLKSKKLAYDGRGNRVVNSKEEVEEAFNYFTNQAKLHNTQVELYVEEFLRYKKELAVMVVRSNFQAVCYPVVETIQQGSICRFVISPASVPPKILQAAQEMAKAAVLSLGKKKSSNNLVDNDSGIYGVELFYMDDLVQGDYVLLNEVAPRPHNSGHFTMGCASIDQFEMHLRAVLDLPIPSPVMNCPASLMVNLLGGDSIEKPTTMSAEDRKKDIKLLTSDSIEVMKNVMNIPSASLHWYNKEEARVGRKIGHFNIHGQSYEKILQEIISHEPLILRKDIMRLLPGFETLIGGKISIPSSLGTPAAGSLCMEKPIVSIIMGSDSDLPLMKNAALILEKFNIPYELSLVSAHRTPLKLVVFSQEAADRGIKVIIAGAGGAAHLPGMVAAITTLPVIGVPVPPTLPAANANPSHSSTYLGGLDALLSIVQMPRGVPVATMSIGNSENAALLAIRILSVECETIRSKLSVYIQNMENEVEEKDRKIQVNGWKSYLAKK